MRRKAYRLFPRPVSGQQIGPNSFALAVELTIRCVAELILEVRGRELVVEYGAYISGTKFVRLGHPFRCNSRRPGTLVTNLVDLPGGFPVLDGVDRRVQVLRVLPRSSFAVFEHLRCPQVQGRVDGTRRTLQLNEVEVGKGEFCPRFEGLP